LSDQARGGFYGSQDADYSLEDDGDYFTWTLDELRAALTPEEARVAQLYYDVDARGEMHHNPAKNVLWIARTPAEIVQALGGGEADIRLLLASARRKMLEARLRRPMPAVDATLYVSWNAMFASAYLVAGRALGRKDCVEFALKTLERVYAEAWEDAAGFAHRVGGVRVGGMLDDQVFAAAAMLDAYEATLERRYFDAARRAMDLTLEQFGDAEGGGFYDRSSSAAPLGGLEVRRKPLQDSPTPSGNAIAVIVLNRLHGYTGEARYRERAQATLECFAGVVPQYGLFAASYALAAILHARHPLQVVVLGRKGDAAADRLENVALGVYRFGKAVLRVTPDRLAAAELPAALAETLPHLKADAAQALVCAGATCQPPTSDPEQLAALLKSSL
jgi:uncharacterized protein